MRTRGLAVVLTTFFLGLQGPTHATEVLESLPAESNLVARVDVTDILTSELARQGLAANKYQYEIIKSLFATLSGVDFEQIDTLWVVSSAPSESIFLLEGRFAPQTIAGKLTLMPNMTTVVVEAVPHVSRFWGQQDGRFKLAAVLGSDLLAVGDELSVTRFLDVWRGLEQPHSPTDPRLERISASKAHLTATLLDLKRWPDIDSGAAALLKEVWLSAVVGVDVKTRVDLKAIDRDAARGLKHLLHGALILAPKHPDVRPHDALVTALGDAVLAHARDGVSILLRFRGEVIADQLRLQ